MRYCGRTHVGKVRKKNEDAMHADGRLFAVADGMGGHRGGEVASATAIKMIADAVRATPEDANVARLLAGATISANEEIYRKAKAGSGPSGMGTTLTAAAIVDDVLTIGHVGDSRAYLLRDGQLSQLTEDHSLVGELLRSGQLTPEQAFTHPKRNVLTQALGTSEDITADIGTHKLRAGDRILLCTDGLTTTVTDDGIAKLLAGPGEVDAACAKLIDAANRGGGQDNTTVIVLDFSDAEPFAHTEPIGMKPTVARRGRSRRALLVLVPLLLGLALAAFALFQAFNNTYYLGVSQRNRVTVFRGVPGSFLGLTYSETYNETTVTRDQLSEASRKLVEQNAVVGDLETVEAALRTLEVVAPPLERGPTDETHPLPPGHPPVPPTEQESPTQTV